MAKTLNFEQAALVAVESRNKGGQLVSKLKMVAEFTPAQAAAMEVPWVCFDKERVVRGGFANIELEYEMRNFKFDFQIPRLQATINITSELATKFKLIRKGDGKKKAKSLMCTFFIMHAGDPLQMIQWLLRVGGERGILKLEPQQTEMFEEAEGKKAKPPKASPPAGPIAGETFQ
jgi:cytochrome bd-type quinol oxidase subunit 1